MKQLIDVQVNDFLLLEQVDDPVQHEFNDAKKVAAGDKPDTAGVNQGVGGEAVWPKGGGAQLLIFREVVSIFIECEELSLEWMIAQCMRDEQRKKDRDCSREVALGKGIDVL